MNTITPKDFFLHIGAMVTLYVSTISLIALLFQVINIAYPDVLNYYVDPYSTGIRWAIASLIIVFPLFILLSWFIEKDFTRNPEKRNLGIRRWLVYLTLFVAGIVIVTDLIVLINSFLGGEITSRFIFKVLVVLILSGFVFGYYLWDLRRTIGVKTIVPTIFAIIACLMVIASLVVGFSVMGSPITQRNIRFDQQKVSDLQNIQWQVVNNWQQKRMVPENLSDLDDSISGFVAPIDPQTNMSYEYRKTSNLSFELCAQFNLEGKDQYQNGRMPTYAVEVDSLAGGPGSWDHSAGRYCYQRTIDPKLYPAR